MSEQSKFIKQVIGHGNFNFDSGELLIYGVPCMTYPVITLILKQRMMEMKMGKACWDLLYQLGSIQASSGGEMMYTRYGYKRNQKNAELANQQGELVGIGRQRYVRFDLQNKHFVVKIANTPFARHYRKLYGIQKEPVDHFIRGLMTGANEAVSQTPLVGIETQCIVMGRPYCVFEIKERHKWDLSNDFVKKQFPEEVVEPQLIEGRKNLLAFLKAVKS